MIGSIAGDIIGSIYERKIIKTKKFKLFDSNCRFTDDTVMTCAISKAVLNYSMSKDKKRFKEDVVKYMQELGRNYIYAGYGGTFILWLQSPNPQPYNSYGNGSAMRVSSAAWVAETLKEAEELAEITASVSHNHPQGIIGAKATASCIYMALNGKSKEEIQEHIEKNYYNLGFTLDEIRDEYKFDVSCQKTVPQAIKSFIESNDYESAIRNAISLGGDADTIAAICGGIAEAFYGIPKEIESSAKMYLPDDLTNIVETFYSVFSNKNFDDNLESRQK